MPHIVLTRLLSEAAHRHVLDHADAQRADGSVGKIGGHRGFLSSRRLLDLRCSGADAPIVTPYRSPPRTPPARAGSFVAPEQPFPLQFRLSEPNGTSRWRQRTARPA